MADSISGPATIATAAKAAASAARGRCRASHSSCFCGLSGSATETMLDDRSRSSAAPLGRARRAAERRARRAAADPRWLRVDVVAAGHAREALAGEEDDVEQRRREADQRLDAPAVGDLSRGAGGHAARFWPRGPAPAAAVRAG